MKYRLICGTGIRDCGRAVYGYVNEAGHQDHTDQLAGVGAQFLYGQRRSGVSVARRAKLPAVCVKRWWIKIIGQNAWNDRYFLSFHCFYAYY